MNRKKKDYQSTLELYHHQSPAVYDEATGTFSKIQNYQNNIPEGSEIFEPKAIFKKDYSNSWIFLQRNLTPIEYRAAHTLAMMAKANTNSLEPLNDDTTRRDLMDILNVSINKVQPILARLLKLGVYGKFEVEGVSTGYKKFWILNPYLSFSGKLIKSDLANLFKDTHCARAFNNPEYGKPI